MKPNFYNFILFLNFFSSLLRKNFPYLPIKTLNYKKNMIKLRKMHTADEELSKKCTWGRVNVAIFYFNFLFGTYLIFF